MVVVDFPVVDIADQPLIDQVCRGKKLRDKTELKTHTGFYPVRDDGIMNSFAVLPVQRHRLLQNDVFPCIGSSHRLLAMLIRIAGNGDDIDVRGEHFIERCVGANFAPVSC